MFFRREKLKVLSFNELIENLKKSGFAILSEASGRVRVSRTSIAAVITDVPGQRPHVDRAGLLIGAEIGALVNGGYQQYWLTPSKKKVPATSEQLKALHAFEEDLNEGLGLDNLYNTSLGTISALHLYDRVTERDADQAHKPWQVRIARD